MIVQVNCVLYSYVYSHVFYIVNQQEMNVEYSSKIQEYYLWCPPGEISWADVTPL